MWHTGPQPPFVWHAQHPLMHSATTPVMSEHALFFEWLFSDIFDIAQRYHQWP